MGLINRRSLILSTAALAVASGARAQGGPALAGDMVLGKATAPVTLYEYASASCPHCAHWALTVLPQIRKAYIDTGKVRLVMREILTGPVEVAAAGFLLARRAGPGHYFEVLDNVFRSQPEIYADQGARAADVIHRIGHDAGLSDEQVDAALADQAAIEALNKRVSENSRVGKIEGTPTFYIGAKLFEEEPTFEAMAPAIDAALKRKPAPKPASHKPPVRTRKK